MKYEKPVHVVVDDQYENLARYTSVKKQLIKVFGKANVYSGGGHGHYGASAVLVYNASIIEVKKALSDKPYYDNLNFYRF